MNTHLVGTGALLALLLTPLVAAGEQQETTCESLDPERCAVFLRVGDVAPFRGQLLSTPLSIDLGLKALHCEDRIALEVERYDEIQAEKLKHQKELADIDQAWRDRAVTRLQEELMEIRPQWWEKPAFVALVTVVATVGLVLTLESTLRR